VYVGIVQPPVGLPKVTKYMLEAWFVEVLTLSATMPLVPPVSAGAANAPLVGNPLVIWKDMMHPPVVLVP